MYDLRIDTFVGVCKEAKVRTYIQAIVPKATIQLAAHIKSTNCPPLVPSKNSHSFHLSEVHNCINPDTTICTWSMMLPENNF